MPFLSFSNTLLLEASIIYQKSFDIFNMAYKTCSILIWGTFPPLIVLQNNIFKTEFVIYFQSFLSDERILNIYISHL